MRTPPPAIHPDDEAFTAPARDGAGVGVLLCHGFTGSPHAMRPWAEHLHAQGYAVSVPRLPGHGTTWRDANTTTHAEWYAEVVQASEKLRADCDVVFVAGLSMGGALALELAADRPRDVAGIVLVNPSVHSARKDVKSLLPLLRHVVPSFPGIGSDVKKEGVVERAYPRTPLRAAHSMFTAAAALRERLPEVTQPILLFRSRVDRVVDPSSARIILARVSSRDVEERVLEDSYHVATLDNDAPTVFAGADDFIRRVSRL